MPSGSTSLAVWEYDGPVMHAKYALVDDAWGTVGTFNANASSVALAIEIRRHRQHAHFVAGLADQFRTALGHSALTAQTLRRLGVGTRVLDGLCHAAMAAADADPRSHWAFRARARGAMP